MISENLQHTKYDVDDFKMNEKEMTLFMKKFKKFLRNRKKKLHKQRYRLKQKL